MTEAANKRRLQAMAQHPNRNFRGAIVLPDPPPPPVFAPDAVPSKSLPDALAGLVDRPFLATQRWQEQQQRAFREGAHPKVLKFEKAFIRRMKKAGIPMFAHTVVRTAQEQAYLVSQGVSKDSPDDGLWPHRGCAIDLVHSVKGWNMNEDEWKLIGHLGKEISAQMGLSMIWGGDWSFYDPAHWELKKWKTIAGEYPWI